MRADVSKADDARAMIETAEREFGALHVLMNNAGISHIDDNGAVDTEESVWDLTMRINLKGVFLGCKFGIPALKRSGGGSIINVASFVAVLGAATPQLAYTASKGGVLAMSRELAVIHAREKIRVNALCPGPLRTELLMKYLDTEPKRQRRLVHIPMGRFGEAEEIARAALFLASDESSFTTGATFLVDGGITAAYVTPSSRYDRLSLPARLRRLRRGAKAASRRACGQAPSSTHAYASAGSSGVAQEGDPAEAEVHVVGERAHGAVVGDLELGQLRQVLAQRVLDRRAQLDLDLVRRGLIAVDGQLAAARAFERAARAGADQVAGARGRDHVARHVRERALHLDALDPGRALGELRDQHLRSPVTRPTGTPSSPARMVMISDSPTGAPAMRTLLKRSYETVCAMMPGNEPARAWWPTNSTTPIVASSPAIVVAVGRPAPRTTRQRGSISSSTRSQRSSTPWFSSTTTSVAPPSNAPAIAAFASAVMKLRLRGKSMPRVITSAQRTSPEMPSMSTESQTFMIDSLGCASLRALALALAGALVTACTPRSRSRRTRRARAPSSRP